MKTKISTLAQDTVLGSSSKSTSRGAASIICSDVEIKGSIKTNGALQCDGQVEGDISSGDLIIGSTGQIDGEIKAENLGIKGKIVGTIRARKIELHTGASVKADIFHTALIIQPDAEFEGHVRREETLPEKPTATPSK